MIWLVPRDYKSFFARAAIPAPARRMWWAKRTASFESFASPAVRGTVPPRNAGFTTSYAGYKSFFRKNVIPSVRGNPDLVERESMVGADLCVRPGQTQASMTFCPAERPKNHGSQCFKTYMQVPPNSAITLSSAGDSAVLPPKAMHIVSPALILSLSSISRGHCLL